MCAASHWPTASPLLTDCPATGHAPRPARPRSLYVYVHVNRALKAALGRARSQYPFHSLLHNYVDALLMAVLESGTEPLLVHLVEHCKLLTALASAPQAILPRGGKHEVRLHSHPSASSSPLSRSSW
jgi:hypothetical protein